MCSYAYFYSTHIMFSSRKNVTKYVGYLIGINRKAPIEKKKKIDIYAK